MGFCACIRLFFFDGPTDTDIYTLSLHDALPISRAFSDVCRFEGMARHADEERLLGRRIRERDRKSTRLNSSHVESSYAVFCLKKKKSRIELVWIFRCFVAKLWLLFTT